MTKNNKVRVLINPLIMEINFNLLIRMNLSIEAYTVAYIVFKGAISDYKLYSSQVQMLTSHAFDEALEKGYVELKDRKRSKYQFQNLKSTPLFDSKITGTSQYPDDWIDEWRELWPPGMKSGGYYIKSSKHDSLQKLKQFRKRYPEYDKDLIMAATSSYIKSMAIKGFKYSKLAKYFVMKDNESTLADECQALIDAKIDFTKKDEPSVQYGENEL